MPFFSIIIPLYNKEEHIVNTLQSVFDQNYDDYEIIIINDGSTDTSHQLVSNIENDKIRYFLTKNNGVSSARNYGIKKAIGKLVAFLDADDYWYPNHLEIISQLYNKFPKAGLYATSYTKKFNQKSIFLASFKNIIADSSSFIIVDDYFESSSIDAIAFSSACAIPISVLTSMNGFDTTITHGEDTDLWVRIALQYQIAFATFVTASHNLNATNRSKDVDIMRKEFLNFSKFEKEEKHNPSLKKYLDANRYSIALQYRTAGEYLSAKNYLQNIDYNNLSWKHRFLIKQHKTILVILKKIQIMITNLLGIHLSSFK